MWAFWIQLLLGTFVLCTCDIDTYMPSEAMERMGKGSGADALGVCSDATTRGSALIQQADVRSKVVLDSVVLAHDGHGKSMKATNCQSGTSECVVPAGETWILDSSTDVGKLTVAGTLIWDVNADDLELRACGIKVEDGGVFQVGTREAPMMLRATLYIKKCMGSEFVDSVAGERYLVGHGSARIEIHGRPLVKTFTVLSETALTGAAVLSLTDDAAAMGWRVGDRIGLATTGGPLRDHGYDPPPVDGSTRHTIVEMQGKQITVTPVLNFDHLGGFHTVGGGRYEMAAEVVNMERSVIITGDHDDFFATGQGLHTKIMPKTDGNSARYGVMDVRYARVEYCGQLDKLGRYCFHLHLMGHCPECVFQGNAIVDSFQAGITIHGSHDSLVDSNVLWDNRGVGIYTEDGNEMENTISNNVIICSSWDPSRNTAMCNIAWQGGDHRHGGIYLVGKTNHLIGNHVVGHRFSIFTPSFGDQTFGQGRARGKVCVRHMRMGRIQGNVAHNNGGSGLYLDNQHPRNIAVDSNGMVVNMNDCYDEGEFTSDGKDTGLVQIVEDEYEWLNHAGAVHYTLGDISFKNITTVKCGNSMYWKRSKNFADGLLATKHIADSTFVDGWLLLPGGPFTFWMNNLKLAGFTSISAPQHGFAPTMDSQLVMESIDWSESTAATRVKFGSSGGNEVTLLYLAKDNSLGGHHVLVSPHLNGFGSVPGCTGPLEALWDHSYGCNANVKVRRLNIWGPDMGILQLSGPGYNVNPKEDLGIWNQDMYYTGANAGRLHFDGPGLQHPFTRGGYATPVIAGESYTIEGLEWHGDVIFEFSDQLVESYFGGPETVHLTLVTPQGRVTCEVRASADRKFLAKVSPEGMLPGKSWDLGDCGRKFREVTGQQVQQTPTPTPSPSPTSDGASSGSSDGTSSGWEHYEGLNCFQGHGAAPAPGDLVGTMALADCKDACAHEGQCEGIVVVHHENPGPCWLRTSIDPPSCQQRTHYDMWLKSPDSDPVTGTTTTTTFQTPASSTVSTWEYHEGVNCYFGYGADAAPGDLVGSMTLSECKETCKAERECEGIVVFRDEDSGNCWLRKNIELSECQTNSPWDFWSLSRADSPDRASVTTAPAAIMPPSTGQSWIYHEGLNCYGGIGAIAAPGDMVGSMTHSRCKDVCQNEPECEGVVVFRNQDPGNCWLRKNIRTSECLQNTDWDLWVRA